jgi:predicted nucleic acid-binding protein
VANSVVMGRMRQQYAGQSGPGIEGDIIIGTTAITSGRKLYTSDFGLEAAVVKSGGQAEYVP